MVDTLVGTGHAQVIGLGYPVKLTSDSEPSMMDIANVSGQLLAEEGHGINWGFAFTAMSQLLHDTGTNFSELASKLGVPMIFSNTGLFAYGDVMTKSNYLTDFMGDPWDPRVVNQNSTLKRDFATSGVGLVMGILMMVAVRQIGFRPVLSTLGAAGAAIGRTNYRRKVLAGLGEEERLLEAPETLLNDDQVLQSIGTMMKAMSKNDLRLMKKGYQQIL